MRVSIVRYIPVILWMGVIYFLSAQPDLPHPGTGLIDYLFKKTAHMFMYGVLAWLWWGTKKKNWQVVSLCLVYAISDEWHQQYVANRHPSLFDVGFDMLGVSIVLLFNWLKKRVDKLD